MARGAGPGAFCRRTANAVKYAQLLAPMAHTAPVPGDTSIGESPSWFKAPDSDSGIRGFESFLPCQNGDCCRQNTKAVGLWVGAGSPHRESNYSDRPGALSAASGETPRQVPSQP